MKNRKSNRWDKWDYSNEGYYFVTICTKNRNPIFGIVSNESPNSDVGAGLRPAPTSGEPDHTSSLEKSKIFSKMEMIPNELGNIVWDCWNELPKHYPNFELDEFIVMPDHIHGIVIIKQKGKHTLSHFIGSLKSFSSRKINQVSKSNFQWQRSFYDRIIRDENELLYVRNYIRNNPKIWMLEDLKLIA
jgi:putative transposase